MNKTGIILKTEKIRKEFPGVIALNNVDFELRRGEVHAICGENGAGKSTFCNILTGIYTQDAGEIRFENSSISFHHPAEALNAGIRMLYQERNLIPYLTGAQNILLREEPLKMGFLLDEQEILRRAEELKALYNLHVPLNYPISQLSSAKKQAIEILRALLYKPKVLILDEPTSSLTEAESKALFEAIKKIKVEGVSVILITHKMEEVFQNADTISIFRNGERIASKPKNEFTREECVKLMVNRNIYSIYPPVNFSAGESVMEVTNVSDQMLVKDNTFVLKKGEVLGFYGLIGSGRTELIELIYGLRPLHEGMVRIDGQPVKPDVKSMIESNVYLVPDDRREKGLIFRYNLKKNLTVSFINKIAGLLGIIKTKSERKLAKKIAENSVLKLKYVNINQEVQTLSGGNQQKVIISRWISKESIKVLILDEPTNGIDVGTKFEIYKMIRALAEQRNIGIIFISSELPELTGICDRIYIFKEGRIKKELERDNFDYEEILSAAL